MRSSTLLIVAGLVGATGIAIGAFGAHGLPKLLQTLPPEELQHRRDWLETGARYQLLHAVALWVIAAADEVRAQRFRVAVMAWLVGVVLFSGVLYLMAVTGVRGLGAVVPLGGIAYITGWGAVAAAARRAPSPA